MIGFRAPQAKEAAALATLARETFIETFGHLYSSEDLTAFLEAHKTPEAVAGALADPKSCFRVAEADGELIGYCKIGLAPTFEDWPAQGRRQIELKELYIRSGHQGSGVAATLMAWAVEVARESGAEEMVLSVWSGNAKAQYFYRKHGFDWVADTHFMVGNQRDEEFLFARTFCE